MKENHQENPAEKDLTRRTVFRGPAQGKRTVSSFEGLDEQEREMRNFMRSINAPLSEDPNKFSVLNRQSGNQKDHIKRHVENTQFRTVPSWGLWHQVENPRRD